MQYLMYTNSIKNMEFNLLFEDVSSIYVYKNIDVLLAIMLYPIFEIYLYCSCVICSVYITQFICCSHLYANINNVSLWPLGIETWKLNIEYIVRVGSNLYSLVTYFCVPLRMYIYFKYHTFFNSFLHFYLSF